MPKSAPEGCRSSAALRESGRPFNRFLILALTTLAGLDLVRGNALKVLLILVSTPLSLAIFWATHNVNWGMGGALAAGHLLGAFLGVRITVLKGHAWIRRVVVVAVIVFAAKLWFG